MPAKKHGTIQVNIRVRIETKARISDYARARGLTFVSAAEDLIERGLTQSDDSRQRFGDLAQEIAEVLNRDA